MFRFPVPDSFGDSFPICEANPCHDDKSGKFTYKGRGRCLGIEARTAARRDYERKFGKWGPDIGSDDVDMSLLGRKKTYPKRVEDQEVALLKRREMRGATDKIPEFLRKDEQEARRADSAVTYSPHSASTASPGMTDPNTRRVKLEPRADTSEEEMLSVARHEYGHLDTTPLGKGGITIGKTLLQPQVAEEVRAWKNAIRNSGGDISEKVMKDALSTYVYLHPYVQMNAQLKMGELAASIRRRKT